MSGLLFINVFWDILALAHGPNLRSVVWECVRENDLFLVETCHWSRYIKGMSSTATRVQNLSALVYSCSNNQILSSGFMLC